MLIKTKEKSKMRASMQNEATANNIKHKGLVLLVDDDPVVHMVAEEMLKSEGLAVLSANSGMMAADLFRAREADINLVLMDVSMPDLNGFEVMGMMRRINDNVPVILMSARHAYANMQPHAFENPIAFIGKPFEAEHLRTTVLTFL